MDTSRRSCAARALHPRFRRCLHPIRVPALLLTGLTLIAAVAQAEVPLSEGTLVLTGTIAHGEIVTIRTDGTYDFGTRSNARPLYVYAGDSSGSGSPLGRTTANLFAAVATFESDYAVGGFEGAMVFNHKGTSAAIWGGLLLDPSKPSFVSGFRLRDFDMTQSQYQNSSGGLNLKTHRIWAGLGPTGPNNFYIGYQGSEGGNCRAAVENVPGNPNRYYSANPEPFLWQDEVVAFRNSSAHGVLDGRFRHFLDNVELNPESTIATHSATNPELLKVLYLDQISNGSGQGVSAVNNAIASLIVDDEPKQIWVGNASTIGASTRMYPIPTVAWSSAEVQAFVLEGSIPAQSMHFYVMTGWDLASGIKTWASETGIKSDDVLFADGFEQTGIGVAVATWSGTTSATR